MKQCPKCKMTVDAHSDCPVCNSDLSQVPYAETNSEKYVLNKYFLPYLFKKHKIPAVSALLVTVLFLLCVTKLNFLWIIPFVLVGYSVFSALFFNRITDFFEYLLSDVYTDDYIERTERVTKYLFAIVGFLFAAILAVVNLL